MLGNGPFNPTGLTLHTISIESGVPDQYYRTGPTATLSRNTLLPETMAEQKSDKVLHG
jgi:hypothetical protein